MNSLWFEDNLNSLISSTITIHYYDLDSLPIEDASVDQNAKCNCLKKSCSTKYYNRCKIVSANSSILNLNFPLKDFCDFVGDDIDLFAHYTHEHLIPKKFLKRIYKLLHSNVNDYLYENYDFQCAWGNCGRRYLSLFDLQQHYKLHSDMPLKICNFPNCNTVFKSEDYLLKYFLYVFYF